MKHFATILMAALILSASTQARGESAQDCKTQDGCFCALSTDGVYAVRNGYEKEFLGNMGTGPGWVKCSKSIVIVTRQSDNHVYVTETEEEDFIRATEILSEWKGVQVETLVIAGLKGLADFCLTGSETDPEKCITVSGDGSRQGIPIGALEAFNWKLDTTSSGCSTAGNSMPAIPIFLLMILLGLGIRRRRRKRS